MPSFDNLDSLMDYIKKQTELALKDEVLDAIKEVEHQSIQDEVYDIYKNPTSYNRRRDSGGLSDKKNMKHTLKKTLNGSIELSVENITKPNDKGNWTNKVDNLAELIEYGDGHGGEYQYKTNKGGSEYGDVDAYLYLQPRPFTQKTIDELVASGRHIEALISGLRRRKVIND